MTIKGILFQPCRPCDLSNRVGTIIIVGISSVVNIGVILCLTLMPERVDQVCQMYSLPLDGQYAVLIHMIVGLLLACMLFFGVYWNNNVLLCLPWTIYAAFSVMLHFFGLIYAASYTSPDSVLIGKAWLVVTFMVLYLLFGVHIYVFWVVLTYILDIKDSKGDYEKFQDHPEESRSSSRLRNETTPVYKILDMS